MRVNIMLLFFRDASIASLMALGSARSPHQNQQLRALQLERDFERRATLHDQVPLLPIINTDFNSTFETIITFFLIFGNIVFVFFTNIELYNLKLHAHIL